MIKPLSMFETQAARNLVEYAKELEIKSAKVVINIFTAQANTTVDQIKKKFTAIAESKGKNITLGKDDLDLIIGVFRSNITFQIEQITYIFSQLNPQKLTPALENLKKLKELFLKNKDSVGVNNLIKILNESINNYKEINQFLSTGALNLEIAKFLNPEEKQELGGSIPNFLNSIVVAFSSCKDEMEEEWAEFLKIVSPPALPQENTPSTYQDVQPMNPQPTSQAIDENTPDQIPLTQKLEEQPIINSMLDEFSEENIIKGGKENLKKLEQILNPSELEVVKIFFTNELFIRYPTPSGQTRLFPTVSNLFDAIKTEEWSQEQENGLKKIIHPILLSVRNHPKEMQQFINEEFKINCLFNGEIIDTNAPTICKEGEEFNYLLKLCKNDFKINAPTKIFELLNTRIFKMTSLHSVGIFNIETTVDELLAIKNKTKTEFNEEKINELKNSIKTIIIFYLRSPIENYPENPSKEYLEKRPKDDYLIKFNKAKGNKEFTYSLNLTQPVMEQKSSTAMESNVTQETTSPKTTSPIDSKFNIGSSITTPYFSINKREINLKKVNQVIFFNKIHPKNKK
jgi:hypothetical protein